MPYSGQRGECILVYYKKISWVELKYMNIHPPIRGIILDLDLFVNVSEHLLPINQLPAVIQVQHELIPYTL